MFFNFPGFQPQFFSGQGGDPNENEGISAKFC